MLLNKKEIDYKDGLWLETVFESSNILKTDYNTTQNKLYVYFNRGQVYSYTNVSKDLHERFLNAESQGKFFINEIKKNPDKYPFAKEFTITEGEINELKENIEKYKEKLDEKANN